MTAFSDLPDFVLAALAGRSDDDWHRAPEGKWSPAQIVDHLATAIENSAKGFASRADKPPMTRRTRTAFQRAAGILILRIGRFPSGRKAPETTIPKDRPDRAATEARLRTGVQSFMELEHRLASRRNDLFLKHPVLGDLTMGEFMQFHVRHCAHHKRQMLQRLQG